MRSRRVALIALIVGAVGGGASFGGFAPGASGTPTPPPPAAADPATISGYDHDPLSLLGSTRVSPPQMAAFVSRFHTPRTTVDIEQLAQIFVEEGAALGVRADLAWAQSIVETGFFTFPDHGMVRPTDNNFAGIGACDSCNNGNGYFDPRQGVRAQMQLLRGYADHATLADAMIYPPRTYRGIAPTWWEMGNGHWATSTTYASAVISMYGQMLRSAGIDLGAGAVSVGFTSSVAPVELAPRPGDGLYLADPNGQIFDVGDARFWGSLYAQRLRSSVVAVAALPHATGYWIFFADGHVVAFGSAPKVRRLAGGIVAAAAAPHGKGFWVLRADRSVAAFGSATDMVPAPGVVPTDARLVSIAATRTGAGYWLVDSAGRVYAVGDAREFGNLRGATPRDPVVGLAPTPWDDGYWLVTARGRVRAFGAATREGSLADEFIEQADRSQFATLAAQQHAGRAKAAEHLVVAIRPSPSGFGYWLITADGMIVGRGDAPDFGKVATNGVPVLSATSRMDAAPPFRNS